MTETITIEDVDASEIAIVRGHSGRPHNTTVHEAMQWIITLPQGRALKIIGGNFRFANSLRESVRYRWPHLQVQKIDEVILVRPWEGEARQRRNRG